MERMNIVDHSSLDAIHLVTLGHFLGGFASEDLQSLSRTAYKLVLQ